MNRSYAIVGLEDGSWYRIPITEYQSLLDACAAYAVDGKERVYQCQGLAGGFIAFFVSRIIDIQTSTPQIRERVVEIEEALREEEQSLRREW